MSSKSSVPICPKCASSNINFQLTPKMLKKSFGTHNYKAKNATIALCNNCGHSWRYRETKEKVKLVVVGILVILLLVISFVIMISSISNAFINH